MIYRLAPSVELVDRDGESYLISKTPLCALRLNGSLAQLVRRGLEGPLTATTAAEAKVLEQLVAKGFAERLRGAAAAEAVLPTVSVVIPVKDRAEELGRCLASLARLDYPQEKLQVIVVDDGSSDDSALVARQAGAIVLPSGGTGRGPAAAAMSGRPLRPGKSSPSSIPTAAPRRRGSPSCSPPLRNRTWWPSAGW
jgi:mycofactocin glycosyltransferase